MELKTHQQIAVDSVKNAFKEDNKTIVVHPTGLGKTYIALKLFDENKNKKLLFVAPSVSILWQLKQNIAKEYGVKPNEYKKIFPNLEFTTYQQMVIDNKQNDNYIQEFSSEFVVFDEAHHLGAPKWGKLAQDLIKARKDIIFLGLTATPARTDGINVVDYVFDGNLADEITLEEAVATGKLKMPNYVTALYSYEPIIEELELGLEAIKEKHPQKYLMLSKDVEKAKNMIEKSSGLPEIFAKHMVKKDGKYIVFCKDINHLKKMVEACKNQGWFDGVNENVEILAIHSEEDDKTNRAILKRFRDNHKATNNTLRILFSVEKINEGLHLDDIAGEIMLRPTKSKIIYKQQLGRTMSITSNNQRNVVFDIVDNIDMFDDIKDFIEGVKKFGIRGVDGRDPFDDFYLADETREVREILRKISGALEAEWEECYQRSVKWREDNPGKTPKQNNSKNEKIIYNWERYQILRYLKEYQDADEKDIPAQYLEKVNKLKELGLVYIPFEKLSLQEKIDIVVEYLSSPNNDSHIRSTKILEDGTTIGRYVQYIRKAYKEGKLDVEQIKELNAVNFVWQEHDNSQNKTMQEKIDIVVEYLSNPNNDSNIKTDLILEDGTNIGKYVRDIRSAYKEKDLTDEQIEKLNAGDFVWKVREHSQNKTMQEKIDIIVEYLSNPNNESHIRGTQILEDGTEISRYISNIRTAYKEKKLTDEQIEKLNAVNFVWQERDNLKDKTMQGKIDIVVEYLSNPNNDSRIKTDQILEDGTEIGRYVSRIRIAYKEEKLTYEQIEKLNAVNFVWQLRDNSQNKTMQGKIDIVVEYLSNPNNDSNIKTDQILEDGTTIGQYVREIRKAYKEEKLDVKQIEKLNAVNFVWQLRVNSKEKTLQEKIDIVVEYLSDSNNSPDIKILDKLEDGTTIGQYVREIRKAYKEEKLDVEQIEKLNTVNFIWQLRDNSKDKTLQEKIDIVVEYLSNSNNDFHIKKRQILEDGTEIGRYVSDIRRAYNRLNSLNDEQIKKLNAVNFVWQEHDNSKDKTMQEKIDIVVEYLSNPNNDFHIKMTQILADGTNIGKYVSDIRKAYKEGKLNVEQIKELNAVNFVWQLRDRSQSKTMQEKIDIIVEYLKIPNNDSNIPMDQILDDGTEIGRYVSNIRTAYKEGKLTAEQIEKLNAVGFGWQDERKLNAKTIDYKIDMVVKYLSNPNNDSNIKTDQMLEDGTTIGQYVLYIRTVYKKGKLTAEQIEKLNAVRFIWDISELENLRVQKEHELSILEELKQKSEQAESLEMESQTTLENTISKNSQKNKKAR